MRFDTFSIKVVLTETLDFSEEYTVYDNIGKSLGTIMRYDSDGDAVLTCDRFFAEPVDSVNGDSDNFATFGSALDYLMKGDVK